MKNLISAADGPGPRIVLHDEVSNHSKMAPACETRPRPFADATTPSARALCFT
jgi:hypothetical protein